MPGETRSLTTGIESTYKAREVEGVLDLLFYRRLGFLLARLAAILRLTPAAVTWIGGVLGMAAGHLYYYSDVRLNLLGMALHVGANLFDNADGQLARLTSRQSRSGRILDGFVDHLVWVSIYLHLILRVAVGPSALFYSSLGILAAVSHGLQSASADYYRTTYLHFLKNDSSDSLEDVTKLKTEYERISWSHPGSKLLFLLQYHHARQQEFCAPLLYQLKQRMTPEPALMTNFLDQARPAFKWWGFLMTNTRMLALFAALLLARPQGFFWVEATVFNVLLIILLVRQERMSRSLLGGLVDRRAA
jgi:phosphatidylglycerophosphate synthase